MATGIDPKNDYAFKYIFGGEQRKGVLIHILQAVLQPPPERSIEFIEIRNPITEQVALGDKYSILDIKVRDQSGRYFNVEMQMTIPPALPSRILYYWGDTYSKQLNIGEDYDLLQSVISICFLDGVLFREDKRCHLHFKLREMESGTVFSEQMDLHLFQLPLFTKTAEQLKTPLDKWLFFFNNGEELDPANLPVTMQDPEINEATRALDMLTKDELERVRYEEREDAKRMRLTYERAGQRAEMRAAEAEKKLAEVEEQAEQAQQQAEQAQQQARERHVELIGSQIQMCEQALKKPVTPLEQLKAQPLKALEQLADQLRIELLNRTT